MLDILDMLCVKYKRVFPIYSNGRGPMDNYHAWALKDAYVRLKLILIKCIVKGCIGKQQHIEK